MRARNLGPSRAWNCHPLRWLFFINFRNRMGEIHVLRVQRTILPDFRSFVCVELSSSPLALLWPNFETAGGKYACFVVGNASHCAKGICAFPSRDSCSSRHFSPFCFGREREPLDVVEALKTSWSEFGCNLQEPGSALGWFVGWVSEHAEISAKRML